MRTILSGRVRCYTKGKMQFYSSMFLLVQHHAQHKSDRKHDPETFLSSIGPHEIWTLFSCGGSDTCLRARASDRTSITLCSNQTLEADTKRCWRADMLDMYTGVKISQEVSKGNCGLPLCFPRAIYGSNPTNNRANHTFDRNWHWSC